MYFSGAFISAGVLYMLQHDLSEEAIQQTYRIVGVTLFVGIMALFYTARNKKQTVVYLERRKEQLKQSASTGTAGTSALSDDAITSIIESRINVPQRVLNDLCRRLDAGQGAIYARTDDSLKLRYGYAIGHESQSISYKVGEGLVGRIAAEGASLYLDQVPAGYITVFSGLGNSSPSQLVLVPVKADDEVKGVLEIATFAPINEPTLRHLERAASAIASTIY